MNVKDTMLLHSWVSTCWSQILRGRGQGDAAVQTRLDLLVRYHEAVYHYLLRRLRDPHSAGELYGLFALRILESGEFLKGTDVVGNRFRDHLHGALARLLRDHGSRRQPSGQPGSGSFPVEDDPAEFVAVWRQELLNQAWKLLEKGEEKTGPLYHTVLRYQSEHPDESSRQIADALGRQLGRPLTADEVRSTVRAARERFGELLLGEVAQSLPGGTPADLEQELTELRLMSYCKGALEQRQGRAS